LSPKSLYLQPIWVIFSNLYAHIYKKNKLCYGFFNIAYIFVLKSHTIYFMKKLFLALLAAASITSASAQSQSILLYGNLSVSSQTQDNVTTSNWNIAPGIGYQLNNNWTLGVNLAYGSSKDNSGTTVSTWSAGPFARYTHAMGSMFYCFGQADLGFGGASSSGTSLESSVGIMVWPAIGMNVGKGYALNFSLGGIGYSSMTPNGGTAQTQFTLNFGQTMMIGLSKNFACKMHGNHKPGDDTHDMNSGDDHDMHKKHKKAKKADSDDDN